MSGKRRKYTQEFREQAARLVIETAVRWRMWRPRSVWVNKC
jgi:transposase-like protein